MEKTLNFTNRQNITLALVLKLSIIVFLASFIMSPTSKIINNIFYLFVIPSIFLNYKEINCKSLVVKYKWLLTFLIYFWLSSFWSNDFNIHESLDEFKNVLYICFFILSIDIFLKTTKNEVLWNILVLLACIISVTILFNLVYFYLDNPLSTRVKGYFALGHEIKSVWLLGPMVIFMLNYILFNNKDNYSILFAFLSLPIVVFIILTQSRGPLIALFIAAVIMLIKKNNYKIYLSLGIFLLVYFLYNYFIVEEARGLSFRNDIWSYFLNKSYESWFMGHGILADKTFTKYGILFRHPHSVFLSVLYHGGVLGIIIFGKIIVDVFYISFKDSANQVLSCLSIIIIFTLVCFLTDGSLPIDSPKAVWINFWLPVILIYYYKNQPKN